MSLFWGGSFFVLNQRIYWMSCISTHRQIPFSRHESTERKEKNCLRMFKVWPNRCMLPLTKNNWSFWRNTTSCNPAASQLQNWSQKRKKCARTKRITQRRGKAEKGKKGLKSWSRWRILNRSDGTRATSFLISSALAVNCLAFSRLKNLPCLPTISATCSELGTGTHSVMFWDFFERSSKWTPATGDSPNIEVKAFSVLPATRPPSDGECCCCWILRRAAARSVPWWLNASVAEGLKSSMESSIASFSNALCSPRCSPSLATGDDGEDNNLSLISKIDDIVRNYRVALAFFSHEWRTGMKKVFS